MMRSWIRDRAIWRANFNSSRRGNERADRSRGPAACSRFGERIARDIAFINQISSRGAARSFKTASEDPACLVEIDAAWEI